MTPAELIAARGQRTQLKQAQRMHISVAKLRNWEQGVTPIPAYVALLVEASRDPEWTYALVTADRVYVGTERSWSCESAQHNAAAEFMPRQLVHQIHEPSRTVYCFETARSVTMPALVYADR